MCHQCTEGINGRTGILPMGFLLIGANTNQRHTTTHMLPAIATLMTVSPTILWMTYTKKCSKRTSESEHETSYRSVKNSGTKVPLAPQPTRPSYAISSCTIIR